MAGVGEDGEPPPVVVVGGLQVQPEKDGGGVLGHGPLGDEQPLGDGGIRAALGHQREHLALARAQRGQGPAGGGAGPEPGAHVPGPRGATAGDPALERGGPVFEAGRAGAVCRVGAADAVVADGDPQRPALMPQVDPGLPGMGVLGHVGQQLADREVGGRLDRRGRPAGELASEMDPQRQVQRERPDRPGPTHPEPIRNSRNGLFEANAGGAPGTGCSPVSLNAQITPVTTRDAGAAVMIQPTQALTASHSRSRQLAGSPSSHPSRPRKLRLSPPGGGRYGSAIGTSHHSPASRLVKIASRRTATRAAGTSGRLTASPARTTTTGIDSAPLWRTASPAPSRGTTTAAAMASLLQPTTTHSPYPSAAKTAAVARNSTRTAPAAISPHRPSPRTAATAPPPIQDQRPPRGAAASRVPRGSGGCRPPLIAGSFARSSRPSRSSR